MVTCSIKWRDTRKSNICNDTAGPDVALGTIIFSKNLRSDVIWCSQLLVKLLVLVKDEGRSEIDDLDLIEFLVLLQQDIFGLKISVNDVILVAVINARQNLFHENGRVLLRKLASRDDLIEELTTLADISDDVISLLVLEELVHLKNIRVVKIL